MTALHNRVDYQYVVVSQEEQANIRQAKDAARKRAKTFIKVSSHERAVVLSISKDLRILSHLVHVGTACNLMQGTGKATKIQQAQAVRAIRALNDVFGLGLRVPEDGK